MKLNAKACNDWKLIIRQAKDIAQKKLKLPTKMKTNFDLKNKTQSRKITFLIIIFFCFFFKNGFSQPPAETVKLLSRLDLSKPGLEKVKQSSNNPEQAATELL